MNFLRNAIAGLHRL